MSSEQVRDLARGVEHDAGAPRVAELAGDGEVAPELLGRPVVVREQDQGPARGAMGDGHAVAVTEGPLQVQALPREAVRVGGLAAAEQQVGRRVADLGQPAAAVAFLVDLVGPEEAPLGGVEVAFVGVEQAVVMEPQGAGRAGPGDLRDDGAVVEERLCPPAIVPGTGPQDQRVDGGGCRPRGAGRLGQLAGRRELLLGLGLVVLMPGLCRQPSELQPRVERRRLGVDRDRPAEQLARLGESPQVLRPEGAIQQLVDPWLGHGVLTCPGRPRP
jgi:hypothetical protein